MRGPFAQISCGRGIFTMIRLPGRKRASLSAEARERERERKRKGERLVPAVVPCGRRYALCDCRSTSGCCRASDISPIKSGITVQLFTRSANEIQTRVRSFSSGDRYHTGKLKTIAIPRSACSPPLRRETTPRARDTSRCLLSLENFSKEVSEALPDPDDRGTRSSLLHLPGRSRPTSSPASH